jgi:WD40 repeat protein
MITAIITLVVTHGSRAHPRQPLAAAAPSTAPSEAQPTEEPGPTALSTAEIAYIGTGGGIWALEPDGSTSTWAGPAELSESCDTVCIATRLEWSPDGRTLAVLTMPAPYAESGDGDVTVQLMAPGGGDLRTVFACPDAQCERNFGWSVAWSPDSRQVAVTVGSDLYVADVDGGSPHLVCTCNAAPATYLRDGRLAIVDGHGLAAIDPDTRQTSSLVEVPHALSADWTPDRTVALIRTGRGSVVVDLLRQSSRPAQRLHASLGAWSPDSLPYAFTVQRTLRRPFRVAAAELWVTGPSRRRPKLLHRFSASAGDARSRPPVWSPDGSRIALFFRTTRPDGTVRIMDARTGEVLDAFMAEGGVAWRDVP